MAWGRVLPGGGLDQEIGTDTELVMFLMCQTPRYLELWIQVCEQKDTPISRIHAATARAILTGGNPVQVQRHLASVDCEEYYDDETEAS